MMARAGRIALSLLALAVLLAASFFCLKLYLLLRLTVNGRNPERPAYTHEALWEIAIVLTFLMIQVGGGTILAALFAGPSVRELAIKTARDAGTEPIFDGIPREDSWEKLKARGIYTLLFSTLTVMTVLAGIYLLSRSR
jgi:hypothetical protein